MQCGAPQCKGLCFGFPVAPGVPSTKQMLRKDLQMSESTPSACENKEACENRVQHLFSLVLPLREDSPASWRE